MTDIAMTCINDTQMAHNTMTCINDTQTGHFEMAHTHDTYLSHIYKLHKNTRDANICLEFVLKRLITMSQTKKNIHFCSQDCIPICVYLEL